MTFDIEQLGRLIAVSSRSESSRSNVRAKTSWNTSSASFSGSRNPRTAIAYT
jgi:hypothetical protein